MIIRLTINLGDDALSRFSARDVTLTATFSAMAVAAAVLIRVAGPLVPFSPMPFVVMLAGGLLGPRLGALSIIVYILMCLIGVPVFASPPFGGPAYVFVPTFGFLLGFVCSAYVIGLMLKSPERQELKHYLLAMFVGILVYNAVGLPYLYVILTFYLGGTYSLINILLIGFFPFVILDMVKGVAAAFLARAVAKRLRAYGSSV